MNETNVQERVIKVVALQLGFDTTYVKPEMLLIEDLGADSLDLVEIVMTIEEEFDMELNDDDIIEITTAGEAINHILSLESNL